MSRHHHLYDSFLYHHTDHHHHRSGEPVHGEFNRLHAEAQAELYLRSQSGKHSPPSRHVAHDNTRHHRESKPGSANNAWNQRIGEIRRTPPGVQHQEYTVSDPHNIVALTPPEGHGPRKPVASKMEAYKNNQTAPLAATDRHAGSMTESAARADVHSDVSPPPAGQRAKMILHDGSIAQFSKDFDPSKKINLLVYNHGWDHSANGWYQKENLEQIMQGAKPNTLIISPEWQKNPGSRSYTEGGFDLAASLREISNKTPGLNGRKIDMSMVNQIDIIAHSAGHAPTEAMLANKEIRGKIKNIAYLDALYRSGAVRDWVMNNEKAISHGEKGFYDFYTVSTPAKPGKTASNSKQLIEDLNHAGVSTSSASLQFNRITDNHNELPKIYIPKLLPTF